LMPVILGTMAGLCLGVRVLLALDADVAKTIAGLVLMGVGGVTLLAPRLQLHARLVPAAGVTFGFFGGVLGGIAAMAGPLVFIFLLAKGRRGQAFTKEASLYLVVSSGLLALLLTASPAFGWVDVAISTAAIPGERSRVTGPPPLTVHLTSHNRQDLLTLIGHSSPQPPPRTLGTQPVRRGAWNDLVFHIKWSTGRDGFVEAWLNGRPWTQEKMYGPTLYSSASNYLRLGLYRAPGVPTTNYVYYDEIRIGDSYQAVAP